MKKNDFDKEIYRLRVKYNPTRRKQIFETTMGIFWSAVVIGIVIGFGWFCWFLCGNGFGFWGKAGVVAGFYLLFAFFCLMAATPGVGCIPVKFDRRD